MAAELSESRFPLLPPRSDPSSQGKFNAAAAASPAASHGSAARSNRATRKASTRPAPRRGGDPRQRRAIEPGNEEAEHQPRHGAEEEELARVQQHGERQS